MPERAGYCKHFLPISQCSDCRGAAGVWDQAVAGTWHTARQRGIETVALPSSWQDAQAEAEIDDSAGGPVIDAKWHGRCRACGQGWEPGDQVTFSEEEDAWVHQECGP